MNVKVSITGVNEIDQAIKNLPLAFQHSSQQSAHVAAARPLVERMKLLAPEGPTGNLVDSVGIVRLNMSKATNVGEIQVGPRRGRFKGNHAHMVEYGTKLRKLRGRGKYKAGTERGVMPKHPFVQPAFAQTKGEVEKGIAVNVGKSVVRLIKRYVK
jgi:HK97 gp10 family phage protein